MIDAVGRGRGAWPVRLGWDDSAPSSGRQPRPSGAPPPLTQRDACPQRCGFVSLPSDARNALG